MHPRVPIDEAALEAFRRRHRVASLSLFGSALTDGFGEDSDLDVLVEFEAGSEPTLFALAGMEQELAAMLPAPRRVDLRTPEDLSRYFRAGVVREAVPLVGPA